MFGISVSTFAYIAMIVVALIIVGGSIVAPDLDIEQRAAAISASITLMGFVAWRSRSQ